MNAARLRVKYNNFDLIISVFYFTRVTTSETEVKLFQPLREFSYYFKIISATLHMWENIREMRTKPLK